MNLTRLFAGSAVALPGVLAEFHSAPARHWVTLEGVEIHRIQAHFDSVLAELSARDIAQLSSTQRSTRARLLATLHAYRDRGVFPHNYDFPGRAVPYFIDRKTGTLCAVAHLVASTGRRDIVDRVARVDNNTWVRELAGDTAFASWLDASGLTLAEAARIQVPYQTMSSTDMAAITALMVGTPIAFTSSVATSLWNGFGNAQGRRTTLNAVGMTSGLISAAVGVALIAQSNDAPPAVGLVGAASAAAGAVSIALSS